MKKNWLAAAWARRFRTRPLVPDAAFQDATEPYPGHWRRFPARWPVAGQTGAQAAASEQDQVLSRLPDLWRRVVSARARAHGDDRQVADRLGLTLSEERAILARARAAARDELDRARKRGST